MLVVILCIFLSAFPVSAQESWCFGCFLRENKKTIDQSLKYSAKVALRFKTPPTQLYGWAVTGLFIIDDAVTIYRNEEISAWGAAGKALAKGIPPILIDQVMEKSLGESKSGLDGLADFVGSEAVEKSWERMVNKLWDSPTSYKNRCGSTGDYNQIGTKDCFEAHDENVEPPVEPPAQVGKWTIAMREGKAVECGFEMDLRNWKAAVSSYFATKNNEWTVCKEPSVYFENTDEYATKQLCDIYYGDQGGPKQFSLHQETTIFVKKENDKRIGVLMDVAANSQPSRSIFDLTLCE